MAKVILHPETNAAYPESIRSSDARMALFDLLGRNEKLAVEVDNTIRKATEPGWRGNRIKRKKIVYKLYEKLIDKHYGEDAAEEKANEIFGLVERQEDYDV